MKDVKSVLQQLHKMLQVLPTSRRRMLYERLRVKIANDVVAIMKEENCRIEDLAAVLKMRKGEVREWIWSRDLKLSELVRLLNHLDSEFYPIIRQRKL